MAKTAYELHMSLKASGFEPKHHKYMLENMSRKGAVTFLDVLSISDTIAIST